MHNCNNSCITNLKTNTLVISADRAKYSHAKNRLNGELSVQRNKDASYGYDSLSSSNYVFNTHKVSFGASNIYQTPDNRLKPEMCSAAEENHSRKSLNIHNIENKILDFFGIKSKTETEQKTSDIPITDKFEFKKPIIDEVETEVDIETVIQEAVKRGFDNEFEITNKNAALMYKLLTSKNKDNTLRFSRRDIIYMLVLPKIYDYNAATKLIDAADSEGKPLFDIFQIQMFSGNNYDANTAIELAKMTDIEGKSRFDSIELEILSGKKFNQSAVLKYANMKDSNGKPKFGWSNIARLSDINLNQNYVSKFVNFTYPNGKPRFDARQISEFCDKNHDSEFALKLAEMKNLDKKPIFYGHEIAKLSDKNFNHDDVMKLINLRDNKNNPKLGGITVVNILNGTLDYDIVMKYMNKKNWQSYVHNLHILSACKDLIGKTNIDELTLQEKKNLLNSTMKYNHECFYAGKEIRKEIPLLPKDQESYCELVRTLSHLCNIQTNKLTQNEINKFYESIQNLSSRLAEISDKDFADLKISQEYSREDFIENSCKIIEKLSDNERNKVFEFFGFNLKANQYNKTGYTITGYPVDLKNNNNFTPITTTKKTKTAVEQLQKEVIKFTENNPVRCNNKEIEAMLNEVTAALPELRTAIGRKQHGNGTLIGHDYDVMQHSLKVMQKITQAPEFKNLSNSDKKIMLIASLLHDITKVEGIVDKTHAAESGFDAFYISKKFNLSNDEETKLYTLCKHHEWLRDVNMSKSAEELTKKLQSAAFDLRQDNMAELALMFTHADLKAVKVNDTFHDSVTGSGMAKFDLNNDRVFNESTGGIMRSFGETADIYADKIKKYRSELQKTQSILPVTKFPKASKISENIKQVNSDGSTDIKGIYVNKDGLVIIKYNEVENWESAGFPKGTKSRGISVKGRNSAGAEYDIDTGNLKFFVHGLDNENHLTNFEQFGSPDSEALLSVSYAERPESKYRFFRTQGVLLNVKTINIHGGGDTDAGSGCRKTLDLFKKDYIFDGINKADRTCIPDMIKKATKMSDEEYIKFVQNNKDKSFAEIEPAELGEKIIKSLSLINSHIRKGEREYNEMFITNPEIMGVFAYSPKGDVGNPIEFVNGEYKSHFDYLMDYARKNDMPMVIFGD